MRYEGKKFRSLWCENDSIKIIDQRFLPEKFIIEEIKTSDQMADAIKDMHVRGAPLIGIAGAYGAVLAAKECYTKKIPEEYLEEKLLKLISTRPTASNLKWAIDKIRPVIENEVDINVMLSAVKRLEMNQIEACRTIGEEGLELISQISKMKNGGKVNILTHCNAGWLATLDHGTASAPVFAARDAGIDVHVWIGETRPRNQGGKLTAWEYYHENIDHTVISDNSGGYLMRKGLVDIVITGADSIAANGDTVNKIGTYLKALAAKDNSIPFCIAAPFSTVDKNYPDGNSIPIEERDEDELKYAEGIPIIHELSPVANHAFDITPAGLITSFITEKGLIGTEKLVRMLNA